MSKKSQDKNPTSVLHYRNERDRSFGLAGMTLALATLEAMDDVISVSLDSAGPMVLFSDDFYRGISQAASAKAHWQTLMRNYQITTSLALANVLARCLTNEHAADSAAMLEALYPVVEDEGKAVCSLEEDEIRSFYDNSLMQARRTFGNPRLRPYLERLVDVLKQRRTLSGREIAEELHALRII